MTDLVKKILFVAANPGKTARLSLDKEASTLQKSLDRSKERSQFELITRWAVDVSELRRAILDTNPHIIHFSGHGSREKGLVLDATRSNYQFTSGQSLADLVRACTEDQIECVILNACNSTPQASVIARYVDYVIGMSQTIGDRIAVDFSGGFYDALFAGKHYATAYEIGRNAIDFDKTERSSIPVLMGRNMSSLGSSPDLDRLSQLAITHLESPEGPVPLSSPFYVERSSIETDCYRQLMKPGALIRVKAARQMGKSSLLFRIVKHGEQQGYHCVSINFQEADAEVFESLERFLLWFCATLAEKLELDIATDEILDNIWASKYSSNKPKCTKFFKQYLLKELDKPLVLCLDEVDIVFQYQKVSQDFFGLLRAWHEDGQINQLWQKLRLVIAHSREDYPSLDIDQSPFNVGEPVSLPEFSRQQVDNLAKEHKLDFSRQDLNSLLLMVGGHPYLVRVALHELALNRLSFDELMRLAPTEEGPYKDHLRRHLTGLLCDDKLIAAMKTMVSSDQPVVSDSAEAFQLDSMGLIRRKENAAEPLCNLYRKYFGERLQ
ncbi:MAG: AAA-like domain-containing protein [Cyanobacteria bacterium J06555_13]